VEGSGRRRDYVGYGRQLPPGNWANGARIVINIALNYEEGAERSLLDGDTRPEYGGEVNYPMPDDIRNLAAESNFEYGSRVGVWRLLDIFSQHDVITTFLACGRALERNPELGPALAELGHEPCSHGYRWGEHFRMDEAEEREEIRRAIVAIEEQVGRRPVGWYCRFAASLRTRQLLAEEGGFLYDSDAYNDDLPYYVDVDGKPWLVVPYAMDTNDGRFASAPGYSTPDQFYGYLVQSFDRLYLEGNTVPKLMSVGLHCRISGRPGRSSAIDRFIAYAKQHDGVWFATREQVARAWLAAHPPTMETTL
jgi:peptidoglycan/xylan/chitin deacetylase (PgdA/CDA1 family)